jgi:hypothetical protein
MPGIGNNCQYWKHYCDAEYMLGKIDERLMIKHEIKHKNYYLNFSER